MQDEQRPDADEGAEAHGADAPPAGSPDAPGQGAEPVTRLVLVVLGIALLGLLTWWLSPTDDVAPPPAEELGAGTLGEPTDDEVPEPPILISVFGGIDDRFFPEPCARIPGGGLLYVRAAVEAAKREVLPQHLGVSMGDLCTVPGPPGLASLEMLLGEVLPLTGVELVAAGVGELQHGVGFARGPLSGVKPCVVLCANALDAEGNRVLRGWQATLTGDHSVLTVAVAAESVAYELVARGSDIRIGPAAEYAARALEEGRERAADMGSPPMTTLLLVQGTLEEAEAIAGAVPGFDVVVASRGGLLPDPQPRVIEGTTFLYPGRGARFSWEILTGGLDDAVRHRLQRIGERVTILGSPYEWALVMIGRRLAEVGFPSLANDDTRAPDPRGDFAGSRACADCHPDEVVQHDGAPHARMPEAVLKDKYAGSPACLGCHATGAFHRGGWLPGDTTDLVGVSCEACHGPAAAHVADPGPGYGAVSLDRCYDCHLPDRSPGFDAEAVWDAVRHGAPPREEGR